MEQIFFKEEESEDMDFKLPDISGITKMLDETILCKIKEAHQEQNEKEGNKKRKQRVGGEVCICQHPDCRIGPMQETV